MNTTFFDEIALRWAEEHELLTIDEETLTIHNLAGLDYIYRESVRALNEDCTLCLPPMIIRKTDRQQIKYIK